MEAFMSSLFHGLMHRHSSRKTHQQYDQSSQETKKDWNLWLLWHTLRLCLKLCLSHTISIKESKPLMESKSKTPNSLMLVDNSRKELFMACETFAEMMRKDRSNKCQDLAATLLFSASIADPAPTLTTFTSAWEELLAHSNNPLFSLLFSSSSVHW